jgi:hypothetical protein
MYRKQDFSLFLLMVGLSPGAQEKIKHKKKIFNKIYHFIAAIEI